MKQGDKVRSKLDGEKGTIVDIIPQNHAEQRNIFVQFRDKSSALFNSSQLERISAK